MKEELFSNSEKPEYIICAAVWFKDGKNHEHQPKNVNSGFVICGRRHHNCLIIAYILGLDKSQFSESKETAIQGFLTSKDRFLDRRESAIVAMEQKQTCRETDFLFSEDLY